EVVIPTAFFGFFGGLQYFLIAWLLQWYRNKVVAENQRRLGRCVQCDYDLRGSPANYCSECGHRYRSQ
ncbi:MAG: hypothetical protein FWC56_00730, partial [Phycisphaerae bacterium]|nr:hypothetical protein [Phycisphaerae bacterium]